MDTKAEELFNISPYNYVSNNPIIAIDPNGEKGTVVIFGQATASVGVTPGVGATLQTGRARDEIGSTQFAAAGYFAGVGQPRHGRPEGSIGFDVEAVDAGVYYNRGAETFGKAFETGFINFHGGPIDVGFNEGGTSISIGLGFGAGIDRFEIDDMSSISVSRSENRSLPSGIWSVSNPTLSEDGESYTGTITVTTHNFYSNGSWSMSNGTDVTDTNITVTSGVKYDDEGNPMPMNNWKSDEYRQKENEL